MLCALLLLLLLSLVSGSLVVISPQKSQKSHEWKQKKASHAESPGDRLIHSRRKKNFELTPRALQDSDEAQTSTTVSGRPSRVDPLRVLAKSARTKRNDRKKTKISQIYVYVYTSYVIKGTLP